MQGMHTHDTVAIRVPVQEEREKDLPCRKDYGLNCGKAFAGAILKIKVPFFPTEALQECPGSIRKIKEGCPVVVHQETLAGGYLQHLVVLHPSRRMVSSAKQ